MEAQMNTRYTLTEANELLKLVKVIAAEMLERRTERRRLAQRREQLEAADTPEGLRSELAELDARIWEHDEALATCSHEFEDLGLTVLRPIPLTIHIPGRSLPTRSGSGATQSHEVVFCWQEGEDAVCFGHPLGEEQHPRRPLRVAKRV
ncbi:MAG TPA: DUF2203 family protein [bacterium]|nr:DUF2203 family protein [bacterium]